ELFPDWRHFCLITNRLQDITLVEAEHRDHAVVEQVIADLKVVGAASGHAGVVKMGEDAWAALVDAASLLGAL
ncbi:MAG: hypothetical protein LC777_17155, partial [Actinobacteria bacterium]|nr:hypothetical protein [Actinomycetota bacterium]